MVRMFLFRYGLYEQTSDFASLIEPNRMGRFSAALLKYRGTVADSLAPHYPIFGSAGSPALFS
jgi:hypothetical protein